MTKTKKCRVTHRVVNVKRHTKALIIDGKTTSISAAVKLARAGKLNNICVNGRHIQSTPSRRQKLLDLPIKIV